MHPRTVASATIIILEMWYTDDYVILWKGAPSLSSWDVEHIPFVLDGAALQRYPFPRERDTSFTFVGIDILPELDGAVCTRTSTKALGTGSGCMPFDSFSPLP